MENTTCARDAENDGRNSNDGGAESMIVGLHALLRELRRSIRAQRRMNTLLESLLEQNAAMLEAMAQNMEDSADDDDEPQKYLDDTPIV